jgi:hypothetical protein
MNRVLKFAAFAFCLILLLADSSPAKEWRGILPLRSTRTDVERLYKQVTGASLSGVGLPTYSFNILGEGRVDIFFLMERCWQGWDVEPNTVVSVTVNLTTPIPFEKMRADLESLPYEEDDTGALYYKNKKEGIYYAVQAGKVVSITYGPSEQDQKLTCKEQGLYIEHKTHGAASTKANCDRWTRLPTPRRGIDHRRKGNDQRQGRY